ncbi:Intradiol ring-cleavage dioxygenase, partial [Sphaerosporella brunnea]
PTTKGFDFWHCNSAGVYSGIVANGNGDCSDTTNINTTFLRGLINTNDEGVAQFTTIFPSHYTSRATHIHVLATMNATILPNNTLSGGSISHVGQLFSDQSLISEVELNEPYASNTQELTTNVDDTIMSGEAASMDPVFEYVLLGDEVSEGVLAWISIGIDASASYDVSPAASWTENGGVSDSNSGGIGGGMGGGAGHSAAFPSGAAPSGASPSLFGTLMP